MSDIINRAKQLLDGATPGPWEPHADLPKCLVNLGTQFAVAVVPDSHVVGSEDESNRNLIAAAPEMAQALAEETWEYSVQAWVSGEWLAMITCNYGTTLPHRGKTFPSKKESEEFAKGWTRGTPTRIVRRRVSPPEVVNE